MILSVELPLSSGLLTLVVSKPFRNTKTSIRR